MAIVTGSVVDASEASMTGRSVRLLFTLNKTSLYGDTVVVNRPIPAQITGERFSVNLTPTALDDFYTIRIEWLDSAGKLVQWRELSDRIQVPENGGDIGGGVSVVITPDTVAVQLAQPVDGSPFWLEASIGDPDPGVSTGSGDLYRWVN